MKKLTTPFKFTCFFAAAIALSACQSTQSLNTVATAEMPDAPIRFAITGKIGISTQGENGKQGGSAFYGWAQDGERFSIDLTGALGIGATEIRFDGRTATLSSERTGELQADSPEALLLQATGWQAPISQLPYWIAAKSAPSDSARSNDDLGRISSATNDGWTAQFSYAGGDARPNRIVITHTDGHRVVLTISHQKM